MKGPAPWRQNTIWPVSRDFAGLIEHNHRAANRLNFWLYNQSIKPENAGDFMIRCEGRP
jgi:hypothetical protein